MDLNKKVLVNAYEPFFRLSLYNFVIYTLVIIFFGLYILVLKHFFDLKGEYPWRIIITLVVLLYIKAFGIIILSLLEKKCNRFGKVNLKIKSMETDGIFEDYKNANQEIKKCYPKKVDPERIKLVCIDENGRKFILRIIGSKRKIDMIKEIFVTNKESVDIIYGMFSRIIIRFDSKDIKIQVLNRIF